MTIRTRVIIALAISTVALGALAVIALLTAADAFQLAREPVSHIERLRRVHEFSNRVGSGAKEALDIAYDDEPVEELQEAMALAREALAEFDPDLGHRARGERSRVTQAFEALERQQARVIELVLQGDREAAREVAQQLGELLYEREMTEALAEVYEDEVAESRARWRTAEHDASRRRRDVIVVVVLAALALAAGAVMIVRVQRRVAAMAAVVRRVGDGDLGARSTDEGSDELGALGRAFNGMTGSVAAMMSEVAAKEVLASELALASRLQLGVLPRTPHLSGVTIHGEMRSASAVGGDYYDVIETARGGWIAIGDVSGHGFHAGMVMLMAQSAIAAAVQANPDAAPSTVLRAVNLVLYENLRRRVGVREHMTLTLLRYTLDGRVVYAGAHVELLVRASSGAVDILPTDGAWMGVVADVGGHVVDHELVLAPGATLVLHTDGLTEARGPDGSMLGLEALVDVIARTGPEPEGVPAMCRSILSGMVGRAGALDDDATVVVFHRDVSRAAMAA